MLKFLPTWRVAIYIVAAAIAIAAALTIQSSLAPSDFPLGTLVTIQPGTALTQAANILADKRIIGSAFFYKAYVTLIRSSKGIRSGTYLFATPESALRVALRTAYGIDGLQPIKVTIPEGSSLSDISMLLVKDIPNFDVKQFLVLAKPQTGYLFPDTYFWNITTAPQQIVNEMRANFDHQIVGASTSIAAFGKPLKDVIIMASIVEREAATTTDRRIVAGILWKRITQGLALQVDAPFYSILGKSAKDPVTLDDLQSTSPYNTYKYAGLPPGPINNPGIESIIDTVTPIQTNYLYYLSDSKGVMHYAETHDEHVANKQKYLK